MAASKSRGGTAIVQQSEIIKRLLASQPQLSVEDAEQALAFSDGEPSEE